MSRSKLPGKWATDYDQCIDCNNTQRPHFGKGRCRRCYLAVYNRRYAGKVQSLRRKWWIKMGGRAWSRIQREQRNYGGMRERALIRDRYTCQQCGSKRQLTVHHNDRNGRGKPQPNNKLKNLKTLCRKCHMREHREEIRKPLNGKWSAIVRKSWATRRTQKKKG